MKFCCTAIILVYSANFIVCDPPISCDHLGSTRISYKDAKSRNDILRIGCNIKCRLTASGVYKDGFRNEMVDPNFKELEIINECNSLLPEDVDEQDCSHFYEVWKCFEKLREPWSYLQTINDIEEECKGDEECDMKCIYEHLGILSDGNFVSENTPEKLAPAYRKFVIENLELCHNKMNEIYGEDDRYNCKYFKHFENCLNEKMSIF